MKKNIVITGAAGNLGKAVVKKFLKEGHRVIAIVSSLNSLQELKGDIILLSADLTNEQAVKTLTDSIIKENKKIDAALMLVGGYSPGSILETEGGQLKKMYSMNFETAYFMARPVFAQMITQASGGRIVFVGARPALQPKDGKSSLAYALSKSLIFKLADFLNAEGLSKNVISSVIVPSTIDTPDNRKAMPKADFASWVTPESIADVIAFAISDQAGALRDPVYKIYGNA
ncbi:MAG: SDR family NAD(P)-dependent oxidoreductase [Cyclobacteriaceae bacterium]|nr:SDR family NAD(P)-dependent oxidoreductase [Cyclobacteriaceae bacterium]